MPIPETRRTPPRRVAQLITAWPEATAAHAAVASRSPQRIVTLAGAAPAGTLRRDDPDRRLAGRFGPCADVALRAERESLYDQVLSWIAARARATGAVQAAAYADSLQAEVEEWLRALPQPAGASSYGLLHVSSAFLTPLPDLPPSVFARALFLDSIVRRRERDRLFDLLRRAFAIQDDEDQAPPERPEERVPIPDAPERALPRESRAGPTEEISADAGDGERAAVREAAA